MKELVNAHQRKVERMDEDFNTEAASEISYSINVRGISKMSCSTTGTLPVLPAKLEDPPLNFVAI